jgi:hypothetical protein
MYGSSRHVHESPHRAGVVFPITEKVNLAFQDVERFVPVVAMRWRARSFLALLQGDPVALRRRVRRQYRHLCSDHIQCGPMLVWSQDKSLKVHDPTATCEYGN